MKKYLLILTGLFSYLVLNAQYDHQAVFPSEQGEQLRLSVIDAYKPNVVLSYGDARDTMYAIIYNVNDSIAGIYTDHKVYLKPGEDPSTFIYMNGLPNGINAEHSYPQSKGAANGNARSDMHHLFPSRTNANSARGSLPFADVNDSSTDTWFYKTQEITNQPAASIIDRYSEEGTTSWEPREEVKGNIARAIMYFYTMYKNEADNADPNFFAIQKDILCAWHDLDPVDELEWKRTKMIAKWQDDKANPFVLDCTLASRLFCGDVSPACQIVPQEDVEKTLGVSLVNNPVYDNAIFQGAFAQNENIDYSIIDLTTGKVVIQSSIRSQGDEIMIPVDELYQAAYVIQLNYSRSERQVTEVFKIIKL